MSSLGQPSGTSPLSLVLLGLFFFLAALALYASNASFPSYYHADEPSKVDQLVHEYRNFKHPPLMLNIVQAASDVLQTPRDNEDLVRLGRFFSALYAAGTVALMVVLAAMLRNAITSVATGLLCLGLPPLYEAAHYFKEDTLFLFLGVLTLVLILAYRSNLRTFPKNSSLLFWPALLGTLGALLACSRYFTLLLLPFIFFGLGLHRNARSGLAFVAALILTIALVHLPSLRWLPFFLQELPLETHYMMAGHYDVGLPVPHGEYFKYWTFETGPEIWFFLAIFFLFQLRERRRVVWGAAALLLAYWLTLSCLPKYSERYLLPVLLGTLFFAACGAGNLAETLAALLPRGKLLASTLVWITALAFLLPPSAIGLANMEKAFSEDSRGELTGWMRQHLPAGSKVAQDNLVRLEALAKDDFVCSTAEFVPDLGSIQDLQKQGIRYVAICRLAHYPYTEPGLQSSKTATVEFTRRRQFYLTALQQGKILWEGPDFNPKILHPGITLIDIQAIPPMKD